MPNSSPGVTVVAMSMTVRRGVVAPNSVDGRDVGVGDVVVVEDHLLVAHPDAFGRAAVRVDPDVVVE